MLICMYCSSVLLISCLKDYSMHILQGVHNNPQCAHNSQVVNSGEAVKIAWWQGCDLISVQPSVHHSKGSNCITSTLHGTRKRMPYAHLHCDMYIHKIHYACSYMSTMPKITHTPLSDVRRSNMPAGSVVIWLLVRRLHRHIKGSERWSRCLTSTLHGTRKCIPCAHCHTCAGMFAAHI